MYSVDLDMDLLLAGRPIVGDSSLNNHRNRVMTEQRRETGRCSAQRENVLCTTAAQMSLFEHVFKHSLRFYHMSLVWTPPCSALLYSVYADAFQSDCLASFSLRVSGCLMTFLGFTSTSLRSLHFTHLPLFFFFYLSHLSL